nr:MAG TPA: hypothetical protein [Caudoviricetes sp.]
MLQSFKDLGFIVIHSPTSFLLGVPAPVNIL